MTYILYLFLVLISSSAVSATPKCEIGSPVTPVKTCANYTDCTGVSAQLDWNTWCDSSHGMCCQDPEIGKCPDQATPLFNEPKCTVPQNDSKEICSKPGGVCILGHCCPLLIISKNDYAKLGRTPYQTEVSCDPDHPVPLGFYYTYCNKETRKLTVIGKFHENGASQTKMAGSTCSLNSDCPEGTVCVRESGESHKCYFLTETDYLDSKKNSDSEFLLEILLVAVILAGIGLAISLVFFVYYSRTPKKNSSNHSLQLIVE